MPTTTKTLWKDHDVLGGVWWWTWEDMYIPIKDFVSVRLQGSAWIVGPTTCEIRVNDYPVWSQFELIQKEYPIDVDVSMYIYDHADNKFSIGVSPLGGVTLTLSAIVEYTTEPPGPIKPPWWEELPDWWWVPVAAAGGFVLAMILMPRPPPVYVVKGE